MGSDANYENRAYWEITRYIHEGNALYYFTNVVTGRLLFQTGDPISGYRGAEGGWLDSPKVVGSDENYYSRHLWRITPLHSASDKYLIENYVLQRYLFQTGEAFSGYRGDERGWSHSPNVVGSDANYYNRAYFNLIKKVSCGLLTKCGKHAACNSINNHYICTCDSGYTDDGNSCIGRASFTVYNKLVRL